MDFEKLMDTLQAQGMKLLSGILVLVIGLFIIHWVKKLIDRSDKFQKIDPTLKGFLNNLIKLAMYVILVLTVANTIGIPLTSIVTVLASAGVAVSLAMQGALSNFVSGVMILLLKPFRANDFVKIDDMEGTVKAIGMFYMELVTPDNKHISLPNSNVTGTSIINYSREGTRRIDITVGVAYDSDIDKVRATLLGILKEDERVLTDPAPQVLLNSLADSSMQFIMRFWCRSGDYLTLNFLMTENAKLALDRENVVIPFPQMDVHVRRD